MKDVQYRKDFVRGFGELFTTPEARAHREGAGIERMEYNEKTDAVDIYFSSGSVQSVNVAGDSLAAIAYDVARYALF